MLRWLSVRITKLCFRALRDGSAVVSPLMALMIIPIAGATAMATEMGQWYYFQRAMQNAADAAALAAAITNNNTGSGSTSLAEGRAAAAKFGFEDGEDNTEVDIAVVTCPTGAAAGAICYEASLSKVLPITLSALVGFRGNENDGFAQRIPAVAVTTTAGSAEDACIWSLSPGANSFTSNGGPKPDLAGCSIVSNGDATCNGHDLGADVGAAVGTSTGCGETQVSGVEAPEDKYADLADNIPANDCGGSYATIPAKKSDPALPANNVLTAANANTRKCGDVQLSGDVTLTGSNTLVIFNGTLDLNGHNLRTASGATATIIFSGDNAASAVRGPSDSSTGTVVPALDITAPSSGTWQDIAIYQDPRMTPPASSLDITYTGNDPTWDISGHVYLPRSNVTFSGAVNKSSTGHACFVLVAWTILVNGTGSIFADNNACSENGPGPTVGADTREKLVL